MESGWLIPPDPTANAGPLPKDVVAQTEDVLVDRRGHIYIIDKNWGMRVLRYLGPINRWRRIGDGRCPAGRLPAPEKTAAAPSSCLKVHCFQ